jgi:hypothetical protein
MSTHQLITAFAALTLFAGSCKKDKIKADTPQVFSATGNITATVENFRQSLGPLNTEPGATSGRREITWEVVPDSLLDKKLPAQFFNQVGPEAKASLQRGIIYEPLADFRASRTSFAAIDPAAATNFAAFSGTTTFANVSSNEWPVSFQRAGTTEAAAVTGFGLVVSDVDVAGGVQLEFFNGTERIGVVAVPAHDNTSSFSFVGLKFSTPVITSVKLTHQGILVSGEKDISQGGANDLVVMDDFIYGEPIKN